MNAGDFLDGYRADSFGGATAAPGGSKKRARQKGKLDSLCVCVPLAWLARLDRGRLFERQFTTAMILWWHVALYCGALTFKLRPGVIGELPVDYKTFRRNLFARGLLDLEDLGLIEVLRNGRQAPQVTIINPPQEPTEHNEAGEDSPDPMEE